MVLPLLCGVFIVLDALGIYVFSTLRLIAIGVTFVIILLPCFKEISIGEITLKNVIEKQREDVE